MKRSDMIKYIKCSIRNNEKILLDFKESEITFGKMAKILSESILITIQEQGMQPRYAEFKQNDSFPEYGFIPSPKSIWANKWEPEE
jgi:hypothetical protein